MTSAEILAPGGTIGILGGGQLGRMMVLDAAKLGYRCHIFCPDAPSPAGEVSAATTTAAYEDKAALQRFAETVDLVTYEFENVPSATAAFLAERLPVRPGPKVLDVCQNRGREKRFLRDLGIGTAPFALVTNEAELKVAAAEIGLPAVLKTTELGYDGKGQRMLRQSDEVSEAFIALGGASGRELILEGFVDFAYEASVLVARNPSGALASYPLVENRHRDHILKETHVPAPATNETASAAETIAQAIAEGLALEGLIGVELFVTADGGILVNEMAPRPHNSGHWTMDAAVTPQFEQCIRAVCNLPLGSTEALGPAIMTNLLGEEANDWLSLLNDPHAKLHLYGKAEARAGRKMGHVNRLLESNS